VQKKIVKKNIFEYSRADVNVFKNLLHKVLISKKFINGNYVKKFEKKFSSIICAKGAVGFSSASTAISSLVDIICNGDLNSEIIVPVFSPVCVPQSILNFKYKIRFVDINPKDFLIDENRILKSINKNTKIIMPVHLFGNIFDIDSLKKKIFNEFKKKIFIIEDASQAHLASYKKKNAGNFGDASIFSFYPTKNLGAFGDAGAVVSNNLKLINDLKIYRNYGLHPSKFQVHFSGNNFRMDELQAIFLIEKLKKLKKTNYRRQIIAESYKSNLKNLPINFQFISKNTISNWHVFAILVDKKIRNDLVNYLKKNNIETSIYYQKPLSRIFKYKVKANLKDNFRQAEEISSKIICLPIDPDMKLSSVNLVSNVIKKYFHGSKISYGNNTRI
jgi:dTDP-4-amino-4,6-dideoxygalactose transaminase